MPRAARIQFLEVHFKRNPDYSPDSVELEFEFAYAQELGADEDAGLVRHRSDPMSCACLEDGRRCAVAWCEEHFEGGQRVDLGGIEYRADVEEIVLLGHMCTNTDYRGDTTEWFEVCGVLWVGEDNRPPYEGEKRPAPRPVEAMAHFDSTGCAAFYAVARAYHKGRDSGRWYKIHRARLEPPVLVRGGVAVPSGRLECGERSYLEAARAPAWRPDPRVFVRRRNEDSDHAADAGDAERRVRHSEGKRS